jgi:hypothetical protein
LPIAQLITDWRLPDALPIARSPDHPIADAIDSYFIPSATERCRALKKKR